MAQNRFLQWLVFDWPVKVLAIAAAVTMFFFVQFMQVEQRTILLRPAVENAGDFVVDPSYIENVEVTLRGNERDIYYIQPRDLDVVLDLSSVDSSGLHTIPVEVDRSEIFKRIPDIEVTVRPEQLTLYVSREQVSE
ncbi:MAG: CdaR family protein [Spirochaetota bacterium]